MKDVYDIIKGALVTEKSATRQEADNIVTFKVDRRANKIEIRRAVETLFNVKVAEVRTVSCRGKRRRIGLKSQGKTADWKKAYVRLAEGSINFLEQL